MLVRDLGDAYGIVLQPDHGVLAGQIASAWNDEGSLPAELRAALGIAATRHDDGWAAWERHPHLDAEGRPQAFFTVPVESLLSSYQASADLVAAEDPLAALLVSMHVSGLQRGRYGAMGGETKPLGELEVPVRAFVEREEHRQAELRERLDPDPGALRRAYGLLQVFDVLSLHLGLRPDAPQAIESAPELGVRLELRPGDDPLTVGVEPYPFRRRPQPLELHRRILAKRSWSDVETFRAEFGRAPREELHLELI